eukprot:3486523-Ditylum_brightwellii.AAC.1
MLIQCEHVKKNDETGVYHVNTEMTTRKRGPQIIFYYLPNYMTGAMNMYIGEIKTYNGRFLKNFIRCGKRIQNMGESHLTKWPKACAEMLNLNVDDFTAKWWCMSGATAMAD